jgi:DNA-binding transcriptional MerR regulator
MNHTETIAMLKEVGVNLADVSKELDYRDNAPDSRWDDALHVYSTEELQEIETLWETEQTAKGDSP